MNVRAGRMSRRGKLSSADKTFILDLAKASNGAASIPQIINSAVKGGVPRISTTTANRLLRRSGYDYLIGQSNGGRHYRLVDKETKLLAYLREKRKLAKKRGEKVVTVSVNELVGLANAGADKLGSAGVSRSRKDLSPLLDKALEELNVNGGARIVRRESGVQYTRQRAYEHNYDVAKRFILNFVIRRQPVSGQLLRKVFGFARPTTNEYFARMQKDTEFVSALEKANVRLVMRTRAMNTPVDVERLSRVWRPKIEPVQHNKPAPKE